MSQETTIESTPESGLSSHALLADLVLIQCGWRTESEHERYLAAQSRIMKAGRKIHLQAELDSLG